MNAIAQLDQVVRDFGCGETVVHALKGVTLTVFTGDFVAVAGPSGSGKSTLFNVLSGLDQPTSGTITVDDTRLDTMTQSELAKLRLHRIGFVFQAFNLLPVLTAYENAEYVLMMQGATKAVRKEKVMALLGEVGLAGMEHRFPRELSGGQQQRVAIARALASDPALLLADEPTANLDSETGAALIDLLARLNQEKKITCLFATHDQNVMQRASRLIRLKDGLVIADGAPGEANRGG